jgi:hypothetical protein
MLFSKPEIGVEIGQLGPSHRRSAIVYILKKYAPVPDLEKK